jgi:hypothetical protein
MLGHVLADTGTSLWWFVAGVALAGSLAVRHLQVKHGLRNAAGLGFVGVAAAVALAASAIAIPTVGAGQARNGLPDLISDPPRPAFLKELRGDDGQAQLVLTFDGYVHNIGTGPLDVVGNPQEPGGMVQRVREGGEWREVSTPTVRYETDDGHNHFHLIEAVDYVLWNESQGSQTAAGSKIGFCLVDSEQIEPGTEQDYSEELDNFCQEDNPTATSLRMGISSGWRDVYDATTTLQWVDVSFTAPGRYWIGAITDPNDEIVESNEDNNALIFSDRPAIVPGWLPRSGAVETTGETVEIELQAQAFGTVADPIYVIERGPTNGRLDVPVGAALVANEAGAATVGYTPAPGFTGSDSIEFSVRDRASLFPVASPTAVVTIEATGGGEELVPSQFSPGLTLDTNLLEIDAGAAFEVDIDVAYITGDPVSLYAIGLPPGLWVEGSSIVGVPTAPGFHSVELIALAIDGATVSREATFIVNKATKTGLASGVDRSSPLMHALQVSIGRSALNSRYEAQGLPRGLEIDEAAPVVSGTPAEIGDFDVTVTETDSDGNEHTAAFTWSIRPAVAIEFPL